MFDDPKKELQKLEQQLLEDEEWFERELDSAKRMIGQNPAKSPSPTAPRKPEPEKSGKKSGKKTPAPKKKSIKGPLIVLTVEILGILGLAAYWMLFLL